MKIRIQGIDFDIVKAEQRVRDLDALGFYDCRDAVIGIDVESTNVGQQTHTLVHEVVEVLNHAHDLEMNHQTLSTLASGINQVLQDNPKLFEVKFKGIK